MEISSAALWKKKWLISFSCITAISLIFKNILYNVTLKTLSTSPRTQKSVSPSCQSRSRNESEGEVRRELASMAQTTCPAPGHEPASFWKTWGRHPHTLIIYRQFFGTSLLQACVRCLPHREPVLALFSILPHGRAGTEHVLFREGRNKLEWCDEDTTFPSCPWS